MSDKATQKLHKLAQLRASYLAELPEQLEELEQLALQLGHADPLSDSFSELYRKTHSLKGSAGSYGLPIISKICHQMEDRLTSHAGDPVNVPANLVDSCLAHIDLMRMAQATARAGEDLFAAVEQRLEALQFRPLTGRYTGLVVENSKVNAMIYLSTLKSLPILLTVVDNGYDALGHLLKQKFDLLICGYSLPLLNGSALIAALRLGKGINSHLSAILVSSSPPDPLPPSLAPDVLLLRGTSLADTLQREVRTILERREQK